MSPLSCKVSEKKRLKYLDFVFETPLSRLQWLSEKSKRFPSFSLIFSSAVSVFSSVSHSQRHQTCSRLKRRKQWQAIKDLTNKRRSSHINHNVLGCGSINEIQTRDNRLAALHRGTKSNNNIQETEDIMTEIAASPLLEPAI